MKSGEFMDLRKILGKCGIRMSLSPLCHGKFRLIQNICLHLIPRILFLLNLLLVTTLVSISYLVRKIRDIYMIRHGLQNGLYIIPVRIGAPHGVNPVFHEQAQLPFISKNLSILPPLLQHVIDVPCSFFAGIGGGQIP